MVKKRVSLVRGRAYRCGEGREITVLGCVYCQSSDLYQHQGILTPQWKRQWRHMFGGRDRSDGGGASKAHLVHSECVTTVGLNGDSRRWISSGDRMTGDRLGGSVSDRLGLYSSFCDLERLEAFTLRMLLVRTEPVSADTAGYRDHTQEQVEQSDLLVESIWEFDIIDAGHSLRHRMMLERGDMTGLILVSESECREMRGGVGGQRLYLRSVVSMGINMYAAYYRWRVCEILSGQGDRTTKVVLVDYMVGAGGEATQDRGSWHIEWGEDEQSFVRDAEMCKRESTRVVLVLEDGWEGEIVTGIVCSVIMEREPRVETGGVLSMKVRLILWQCKKQTIVATSTTEAEYVAAASCCGQVLWIQNQMLDYGFNFMNTKIHIDNESTICIVKNPVYHSKTKHIEIRHHFIRDSYEKKLIRVEKIHTDFNVADLLTKAFDGPRQVGFRGVPRPLLPAMLPVVVVDQSAGQADQAVDQPSPSKPLPSSSHPLVLSATTESEPTPVAEPTPHPKSPSPEPDSEPIEHTFEQPSPEHQPLSPRQETEVPQSQDPTHPHVAEERTMTVDDLLQLVPKLITKVDSLETELKQTKLTMGKALVKLVKKVKKMEDVLKRRHVVLPDSEDEDAEISSKQGRNL
ncbi:hypothetical protein Tco_0973164 [Tanacetum coccineum]